LTNNTKLTTWDLFHMERYVCVHGHFYQPPRENAWLESVELQDSAFPYHDWNERITAECYATNASTRLLDERGLIRGIVNNYAQISFNFGPTLLSWLEQHAPEVYQAILEADRQSLLRFSGHGAAMAQAYNHMILPLSNPRDRETQILWGIQDFAHRFQRRPEGMWLPETAVDVPTLETLAEHGIRFTLLAPRQARRIRRLAGGDWQDVDGERIDPTRPYLARLPSGRSLTLFFYDGPISKAVAFEGLLDNGELFAHRLMDGFDDERQGPQLAHIATDGESYGHHHRRGNMALAFALQTIESGGHARLTVYGEYLERHPPEWEVEIFENSSWSCVHGIERWRGDCGCNSDGRPGWHQQWRAPLRVALDWLRDALTPAYEEQMQALGLDPWQTRNDYVQVILDRGPDTVDAFLSGHTDRALTPEEKTLAIQLLELQRHAMLMYTSCGWFFDDVSGLETVQVIQYAGRALQLAKRVFGNGVEKRFMGLMEQAPSNVAEHGNGRAIYEKLVKPAMVDFTTLGAHYAMRSLFEEYPMQASVGCYSVTQNFFRTLPVARAKMVVGRVCVTSTITWESQCLCFGAIHWGDHNISCCISHCPEDAAPEALFADEIFEVFSRAEFPTAMLMLEKALGASTYSLRHLFRDEQRRILNIVLESNLARAEGVYRQIYETNAPLLLFLKDLMVPAPRALAAAAEYVLNAGIRRAFEDPVLDLSQVHRLLQAAVQHGVSTDGAMLAHIIRERLEQVAGGFTRSPADLKGLRQLEELAGLIRQFPFEVNLRSVQNVYYQALRNVYPEFRKKAKRGSKRAAEWIAVFRALGETLGVRVD
jgi:alpha-amylase/alpha-mannosidase (GH57 family)